MTLDGRSMSILPANLDGLCHEWMQKIRRQSTLPLKADSPRRRAIPFPAQRLRAPWLNEQAVPMPNPRST